MSNSDIQPSAQYEAARTLALTIGYYYQGMTASLNTLFCHYQMISGWDHASTPNLLAVGQVLSAQERSNDRQFFTLWAHIITDNKEYVFRIYVPNDEADLADITTPVLHNVTAFCYESGVYNHSASR